MTMNRIFLNLGTLAKPRIALVSTLSTAAGYLLASREMGVQGFFVICGVFLLACGSAAVNQFQDRKIDRLMDRTRTRPIPAGAISPAGAMAFAGALMSLGLSILFIACGPAAGILGFTAAFWYNAVYALLKRKTAFAAIPGAVVGALPPVIGWAAGGGSVTDRAILAVAFFFFIWQVPHFWILLLKSAEDYESAGLPSLTNVFSKVQLSRITFIWIVATAAASLMIPFFAGGFTILEPGFLAAGLWLVWKSRTILPAGGNGMNMAVIFKNINVFALVVISLVSLRAFIG